MSFNTSRLKRIFQGATLTEKVSAGEAYLGLVELERLQAEYDQVVRRADEEKHLYEELRRASRFGCDCPERTVGIHYNECTNERPWVRRSAGEPLTYDSATEQERAEIIDATCGQPIQRGAK